MARFAVLGDLHGNVMAARLAAKAMRAAGLQVMLQVGDCGLLWPDMGRQKMVRRLDSFMEQSSAQFYWIDGNHDAHPSLRELPLQADGSRRLTDRLTYLPRGLVAEIDGALIGALGGAFSVDAAWRKEGKTLWAELEAPTEAEAAQLIENAAGRRLDVLLTHDAPAGVTSLRGLDLPPELAARANVTRELLQRTVQALRPRIVLCGHWHVRHSDVFQWDDGSSTRVEVLAKDEMWKDSMVEVVVDQDRLEVNPLPSSRERGLCPDVEECPEIGGRRSPLPGRRCAGAPCVPGT
ncbi:metallophosphoesterase family protein [Sinomonas sp. RB5]